MIVSYTDNGAYANFLENETGSIEVGKQADMLVLDQNLFEIPTKVLTSETSAVCHFDAYGMQELTRKL